MTLRQLAVSIFAASAALLLGPTIPASAHETGAIHVSSHQVSVGGSVDCPRREASQERRPRARAARSA